MKKATSIISWLTFLIESITLLVVFALGTVVPVATSYYPYVKYEKVSYPAWVWIIYVIFLIFDLIILVWREKEAVDGDHKVAAGVLTLLFVSLPGGILTLCIRDSYKYHPIKKTTYYNPDGTVKNAHSFNRVNYNKEEDYIGVGDYVSNKVPLIASTGETLPAGTIFMVTSITQYTFELSVLNKSSVRATASKAKIKKIVQ